MEDKLLLFFIFFLLIASIQVKGYDYEFKVNSTDSLITNLTLEVNSTIDNNTLFFNFYSDDNYTNEVSYFITNPSIYFNNSNQTFNLSVNINILDVGLNNETYYLKINESNTNITSSKTFFINVLNNQTQPVWLTFDVGEYEYTTCKSNLPETFFKERIVGGSSGSIVNLTSSVSWLKVPFNITIGNENYTSILIEGDLDNLSVGSYQEYIYLDNGVQRDNLSFLIHVNDCGVYNKFSEYIKICDQYSQGSIEHAQCLMTANNKYYTDFLSQLSELNKTMKVNVTRNVTEEVLVEVVKIDNRTFDEYLASAAVNAVEGIYETYEKKNQETINSLKEEKNSLLKEKQQLEQETKKLKMLSEIKPEEIIREYKNEIDKSTEEAFKKYKKRNYIEGGVLVVLIGGVLIYFFNNIVENSFWY